MNNKKLNKIIVLGVITLIFSISLVIFILNYTKDSSSLSIIEKTWINNHKSNIIDVSVYNDVPIYGQDGEGIIFSYLEEFTNTYGIKFNKVSYLSKSNSNTRDIAFKIVDYNTDLSDNDILIYQDYYVLVGIDTNTINDINDLYGKSLGVMDSDLANIRYFLNDGKEISITSSTNIDDLLNYLIGHEVDYIAIPRNLYLDTILSNNLDIVYHVSELYKKYILTVSNDNTLKNILNKFMTVYQKEYEVEQYKTNFLNTFFKYKNISEAEKMNYNANSYNFGYYTYMPYENNVRDEFVGTLSNYLSGFEDMANIEFNLIKYNSVTDLKQALSHGDIDLLFANFNTAGINVDTFNTTSPFKEEYYVLSTKPMVINSIRSLKGNNIYTINGTYLHDYLNQNSINTIPYDNTDSLLRSINPDSIIILDKDTYEYYKDNKFKNYKIIYQDVLDNNYSFIIRDVNKNQTFYELFSYYVSSVNYKTVRYDYHTDYIVSAKLGFNNIITYLIIIILTTLSVLGIIYLIIKLSNRKKELKKEDKLKFIDIMTSLKNRNYLNYNIKKWDEVTTYPQSILIIDLNNIKYINDNYGHAEGDEVIKKAANILLIHQQENTDIMRTDGNEFLIYMVGYDEKKVIEYTRTLSKALKELPHNFGASIGYSMIVDDVKTIDDAINEATLSMRQAKEKL